MKVVFVHGRAQENKKPDELHLAWRTALSDGIRKAGGIVPTPFLTEFPYYGDRLFSLTDDPSAADGILTRGVTGVTDAQELQFFADVAREMTTAKGITESQIAAEAGDAVTERALQNWRSVLAALRLVDHLPGATNFSIRFLKDVWIYLTNKGVRIEVNGIVDALIPTAPDEKCIVVAHSLGSIVAYNVLRQRKQLANIRGFVTIGSPLGIAAITDRLPSEGGTRTALGVPFWFNARDPQDTVALREIDAFGGPPVVKNFSSVENGSDNKHGAVEYLEDKSVAQAIYRAFQE